MNIQVQGSPNVEGIIVRLKSTDRIVYCTSLWIGNNYLMFKLIHYYDLPSLWSTPNKFDTGYLLHSVNNQYYCEKYIKSIPDSSEYELYDLLQDPDEV